MARSENLPAFSPVARVVLERADDPNLGPRELEELIRMDVAISGKILKVANSPAYGGSSGNDLGHALQMLGIATVKKLIVSVAFQQVLDEDIEVGRYLNRTEFWRHSLGTAVAAREIARTRFPTVHQQMFGVGMMHDIGILVLERYFASQSESCFRMTRADCTPLHMNEHAIFGFDHAEIGGLLAKVWGMTKMAQDAITFHHSPGLCDEHYEMACVITLADSLAHICGFTNNQPDIVIQPEGLSAMELDFTEEENYKIQALMVDEVMKAQVALGIGA